MYVQAWSAADITACICLVSLRRYKYVTFVDVNKTPFALAVLVFRRKHWACDLGYEAARLCEMDPEQGSRRRMGAPSSTAGTTSKHFLPCPAQSTGTLKSHLISQRGERDVHGH